MGLVPFFFFFFFLFLSLDLFVSLWSKPRWKKEPTSSSKQQDFSCLFNANFWFVFKVVVFFGLLSLFSALLYLHLLFISFLSVGSATSNNIWVYYTAAQRNIVFFTVKHLRQRKLPVIHETMHCSPLPSKTTFNSNVALNRTHQCSTEKTTV